MADVGKCYYICEIGVNRGRKGIEKSTDIAMGWKTVFPQKNDPKSIPFELEVCDLCHYTVRTTHHT